MTTLQAFAISGLILFAIFIAIMIPVSHNQKILSDVKAAAEIDCTNGHSPACDDDIKRLKDIGEFSEAQNLQIREEIGIDLKPR